MVRPASAGAYLFTLAIGLVVGYGAATASSARTTFTFPARSVNGGRDNVAPDTAVASYRADIGRLTRARQTDPYRWVVISIDSLPTGASTVSLDRRTVTVNGRLVQAWLRFEYTVPAYRPGFVRDERMEIDCGSDASRLLYYDRIPNLGRAPKADEPDVFNAASNAPMYYTPPTSANEQETICSLAGVR